MIRILLIFVQNIGVDHGRHSADLPLDLLTVFKEKHGRNAHNAIPLGKGGALVYIYLTDGDIFILLRQLLDHGAEHLAGAAPGGPEIYHHQLFGIECFIEGRLIKMNQCHNNNFLSDNLSIFSLFDQTELLSWFHCFGRK